jgi:phosphoribosylaminoimidazole-succinocarboxamide synthase
VTGAELPEVSQLAGWAHIGAGKIRDLYAVPGADDLLLLVASDRISAYDQVLPTVIPDKGRILTQLSLWWFERVADVVPHHVVSADDPRIPVSVRGRAVLCRRLTMLPVECVVRGYLAGSGVADYAATGGVCGVPLPPGLAEGSRLDEPIFTPTSKGALGTHDEPMTFDAVVAAVGPGTAEELRRISLAVYQRGAEIAARSGVLLADTKVEIGRDDTGQLVLADELLTPDSSRFWPADQWRPGGAQPSYDKQFVRDWLLSLDAGWDRSQPVPPLPPDVIARTRDRYARAYELLTGRRFE